MDTQAAALSAQVLEAIAALNPRPIRHIVLTSGGGQQAGGAAALSKAGRYVRVIDSIDPRGGDVRASIIAHVNVLSAMTAANVPSASWPTDTYFTGEWSLFSNGEAMQLFHVPAAHSDGDTIVFFRRSDVIVTGAIFDAAGSRVSIRPGAAASPGSSKGSTVCSTSPFRARTRRAAPSSSPGAAG